MAFIFGGNTPWTADDLKEKREIAEALALANTQTPQNVGEGLNAIGRALAYRGITKRANKEEARLRGEFDQKWGTVFNGGGGSAAPQQPAFAPSGPSLPPPDPNSHHALGDAAMAALGNPAIKTGADPASIKAGLVARGLPEHIADGFVMNFADESGLDPGVNEKAPLVPGSRGGFGLYQLTGPRRRAYEAYAAERGVPVDDVDAQLDFMMMELQGPEKAAWEKISGAQNAGEAGAAIVNSFLRPAQEHRAAREAEYLSIGGEPLQGGNMNIGSLVSLASDPMATPQQQAVVNALIQQQLEMADPMRVLEMEKAQLELAQMKNPQPGFKTLTDDEERQMGLDPSGIYQADGTGKIVVTQAPKNAGGMPAAFASLDMQAQAAGLVPGTPEYQTFMRNGGGAGTPAAFVALDLQAKAAGFEPGTPEYQEFMATRGAGLAAEAKTRGEATAEAELAAPADIAAAETTLDYITSLRDHPGRETGSGASSFLGGIPGTDAKEFQLEVERLKAGAFLTAIDQLKGMGALSNAEGQTATAAIAALDPTGTEEGFLKRLAEYEEIVNRGLERARKRSKEPEAASTGGKRTLKWNPATESFE